MAKDKKPRDPDKPVSGGPNPRPPKPTEKPEPGMEWKYVPGVGWQETSKPGSFKPTEPAKPGFEWVSTPGGGWSQRPIPGYQPPGSGNGDSNTPTEPAGRPGAAWVWNGTT